MTGYVGNGGMDEEEIIGRSTSIRWKARLAGGQVEDPLTLEPEQTMQPQRRRWQQIRAITAAPTAPAAV